LHHDYLLSFLLGIIEGLTEFLPVSSTAHLRLAELLFKLPADDPFWKMYSVVIQLGAILCLPLYFWKRIVHFVRTFPKGEYGDRTWYTHPVGLTMIAFVVTAIPAFLLSKIIGKQLENYAVMGGSLLIGGAVMWGVDALYGDRKEDTVSAAPVQEEPAPLAQPDPTRPWADAALTAHQNILHAIAPNRQEYVPPPKQQGLDAITLPQAIWIGACQILSAVFPGTSRSMSTIAAGQIVGLTRSTALEFSFFLSMPTMFVATLFTFIKALHPGKNSTDEPFSPQMMTLHNWIVLAIGFVVSFIVAWAVVAWFMAWVRRRGFVPFAIYRIIIGLAVLIMARYFMTAG
jgi:undecaprenyl-diphosphatase